MSKKMMKRTAALSALIAVALSGTVMAAPTDHLVLDPTDNWYKDIITEDTTYVDDVKLNDNDIGNRLIKGTTGNEIVYFDGTEVDLGFNNPSEPHAICTWAKKATVDNVSKIVLEGQFGRNVFSSMHGNGGDGAGTLTITNVGSIEQAEGSHADVVFQANGGHLDVNVGSITLTNFDNAIYAQAYDDTKGNRYGGTVSITASGDINLSSSGTSAVVSASNMSTATKDLKNTVTMKANNIIIDSPNAVAVRSVGYFDNTDGNCEVVLDADKVDIDAKTAVLAQNGSADDSVKVSIDAREITISGTEYAVQALDNANVQIGGTTKFESADITGNISSAENSDVAVDLGTGGSLEGAVITDAGSTTALAVGADSVWTVTGDSNLTTLTGDGGNIKLDMTTGANGADKVAEVTINDTQNASNTKVGGTANVTDYIAANGDTAAEEFVNNAAKVNGEQGTYTTDESLITGAYTLKKNADGSVSKTEAVNTKSDAVSNANMNLKAHFRAHMNDMNKRMGELRMASGETGAWARMVRGEYEYQGAKSQHNQYQFGYDKKLASDDRWTVGAAITVAEGSGSYGQGSTEDNSRSLAVYGSKLNDDGTFVDLIARYIRMDSDVVDSVYGNGDYDTDGYSFSAEVGKRIEQGSGFWIEPQAELTYGSVDSASMLLGNQYKANFGSMDSIIARLGFSLGKDIKQGNVYARASYLYDFDGESTTQFVGGKAIAEDFGGGWWEVGIGTNFQVSDAAYIYADVEKTFGGELETNWQWNLGVRYSF